MAKALAAEVIASGCRNLCCMDLTGAASEMFVYDLFVGPFGLKPRVKRSRMDVCTNSSFDFSLGGCWSSPVFTLLSDAAQAVALAAQDCKLDSSLTPSSQTSGRWQKS